MQRHGHRLDVALGVLVGGLSVLSLWSPPEFVTLDFREPDALGVVLAVLAGAAVATRSRWPVPSLAVASVAGLLPLQLGYPQTVATFAPLLVLYTVAVRRPLRVSGVSAGVVGLAVGLLMLTGPVEPTLRDWLTNSVVLLTGWALGRSVRARRAYTAGLEERNRALLEARQARTRAIEVDERARIAREMQDLVTHGLTALTVQTAAARRLLRTAPDTAEELLTAVERGGHDAITEMRRILAVLRPQEDTPALRPQPGLADLDELVEQARGAGLEVEVTSRGTPVELDPGVGLTAYRLVQEALDNSRRHAGRAVARVTLVWENECLCVAVEDDSRGALEPTPGEPSAGRGWQSLQERVQAYGGGLRVGPHGGGGFSVSATLPLRSTS